MRLYHLPYFVVCVWPIWHLSVRTCTIEPPLGVPLLYATSPLSSLSSTEDKQDNMHQGFHLGDQQALMTFTTTSSTKCNPVELGLTLKIRDPFLDPLRLHEIPQLETLTMSLTYGIAGESVKPP